MKETQATVIGFNGHGYIHRKVREREKERKRERERAREREREISMPLGEL